MTLGPDSAELADAAGSWRSAYVHIPFCRRQCPYCDFAVVAASSQETVARYVGALCSEISRQDPFGELDAVNFGGGTPSTVAAADLAVVLETLRDRHGLAADAEISIEANPEDINFEVVAGWVAVGFNRVSLGVQSFDNAVLRSLGREHNRQTALRAFSTCQELVGNCSIDLIFGDPIETLKSWERTVQTALGLEPAHLSAYALTIERGTQLWRSVDAGAEAPDPDDQADKYELLAAVSDAGLVRYEVSNYAHPGRVCRYNMATWGQGEYLAAGLGAHGHRGGVRTRNARTLSKYLRMIEGGSSAEVGRYVVTGRDVETERLVLGVRRSAGVALGKSALAIRGNVEFSRLAAAGVVEITDNRLRVINPLLTDAAATAVLSLASPEC